MFREMGSAKTPRRIIDQQRGPECGYEAIENLIQLFYPVGNSLSEKDLKTRSAFYGYAGSVDGQSVLDARGYGRLLADYGIASTWSPFDGSQLAQALGENRVAIAIVDPAVLDPAGYSPTSELHAIVVTNFGIDGNRRIIRYTGIDSNYGGDERHWTWDRFHNAVAAGGYKVLVTNAPIASSHWAPHDVLVRFWSGLAFVPAQTS